MTHPLLVWWARSRRDLPWRRTRDPWSVLVSELMLQQTQVARVIPKYHAFLARFPTVATCAAASAGDVVQLWAGLGYNRRAVDLHRCAGAVMHVHGGVVPGSVDDLLRLPGVGPYTARAVAAFAFEADVGVVDTNAARVLARWTGRPLTRSEVQARADAAVPPGHGWAWNQAVLDLGATVCTVRSPSCGECPVASSCAWAAAGRPDPDPAVRTAGSSRPQSRFEGSDRQGRGRLVDALRAAPVPAAPAVLAVAMGWPDDAARAVRVARTLVDDGLAVEVEGAADGTVWLELPSAAAHLRPAASG